MQPTEWKISTGLTPYPDAVAFMEDRVAAIRNGSAAELVWLVEHPPVYTAGTSANPDDLIDPRFPVFQTGRGGQYTYHGPGQRVVYVMLDLHRRSDGRPDVRAFIHNLEEWLIRALAHLGVTGERREGRVGIWVVHDGTEDKIAAIGVRIRHWISFHGISLNIAPHLEDFSGIVPCGIADHGVTSLQALGRPSGMAQTDTALKAAFTEIFGPVTDLPAPR